MPPKILITSADSLVGRELVRGLFAQEKKIVAGVHRSDKAEALHRPGIDVTAFDFDEYETLASALKGVDSAFLQVPLCPSIPEYVARFCREATKSGIRHVVYLSTLGVDSEPGIQMWRWHREAEEIIRQSGLGFTFLRTNALMQNFVRCWQPLRATLFLPFGKGRVSYVDARDVATVARRVLTTGEWFHGKSYTLTGSLAMNGEEVAGVISDTLGTVVEFVDISDEVARSAMETSRMQGWLIDALLELYSMYRVDLSAEISPSVEHLSGKPPRSFREFVKDHRDAFDRLFRREYHVRTVAPFAAEYPRT